MNILWTDELFDMIGNNMEQMLFNYLNEVIAGRDSSFYLNDISFNATFERDMTDFIIKYIDEMEKECNVKLSFRYKLDVASQIGIMTHRDMHCYLRDYEHDFEKLKELGVDIKDCNIYAICKALNDIRPLDKEYLDRIKGMEEMLQNAEFENQGINVI